MVCRRHSSSKLPECVALSCRLILPSPPAWRQVGDKAALERQYEQEQYSLQQLRSKADMLRGSLGTIRDRVGGYQQFWQCILSTCRAGLHENSNMGGAF
jgi:hypothetical protein